MQFNLYKLKKPILEVVGQTPFVILKPMRCYAQSTCYENSNHITNFKAEDYDENVERSDLGC